MHGDPLPSAASGGALSPRNVSLFAGAATLAVALSVWWLASGWHERQLLAERRAELQARLTTHGETLRATVVEHLALLSGLRTFLQSDPAANELPKRFDAIAAGLAAGHEAIRAVQVFPAKGTVLVHPQRGNEAALGRTLQQLTLDERPGVAAAVRRAIESRRVVVSGPYPLLQGGVGLAARQAIFRGEELTALAAIVMDVPALLRLAGLSPAPPDIDAALRDENAFILAGSTAVAAADPVAVRIVLPDRHWELTAIPAGGWRASYRKSLLWVRALGLLAVLLLASLVAALAGQRGRLSQAIAARMTERERAEQERESTIGLLRLANGSRSSRELVKAAVAFFQRLSGCEAVAIRLRRDGDYPYAEAQGFPPGFLRFDDGLCPRSDQAVGGTAGAPLLDCMCGNVIGGRFDPRQPFFTPGGSFWTNSTRRLLAETSEADRLTITRDRCHGAGFESIALIPLRVAEERLGLLQLGDRRPGRFEPESIAFWERLADHLAVSLSRLWAEVEVDALNERLCHIIGAVQELASAHTLEGVQRIVAASARKLTGADGAAMVLRDGDQCYYADEDAVSPLWKGRRFPLTNCISGWVMLNGQAAVIPDVYADPRVPAEAYRPTFVKSLAMTPVCAAEPIAAIGAYWAKCHRPTEVELLLLQTLADAAARAVENVRLLEDLDRRVRERTMQFETANRELEAFSYSVSHDLRAPLRAIDGYAHLLLEDHQGVLDAEGRRHCATICAGARRMGKLIDDLLAFSRVGRTGLHPAAVDMAALARAVFAEVTSAADRERIAFVVGVLPSAVGDPDLLRQVWANLLANAVKFTAKQARATVQVMGREEAAGPVYTVRDDGAGFDMAHADKLFGVFERLHRAEDFEGTGVGLAIVQRIVARHGGQVWAESTPKQGASFHFSLAGVGPAKAGLLGG